MAISVTPTPAALGAEITGVDLGRDVDDATFAEIVDAWHQYLVLIFRGQEISEDQQIRFCQRFGPLASRARPVRARREAGGHHPGIMLVSNIREDGELIGSLPDGALGFHSDGCFNERPYKASMLYAIEVPSHGGDTVFINMYQVTDALNDAMRRRLQGLEALHRFSYETLRREVDDPETVKVDEVPCFTHPVMITHPETGRRALYVNRLLTREIAGLDAEDSQALLNQLFDVIEREEFQYAHHWRPGDFVMWDNRCTQHGRTDFDPGERRLLRRLTVLGQRPAA